MALDLFGKNWLFNKLACIWFYVNLYLMNLCICLSSSWKGDICSSKNNIQRHLCTDKLNCVYFRRRQRRTWLTECRPLWRRGTSTGSRYCRRKRVTTQKSYRPRQGESIMVSSAWNDWGRDIKLKNYVKLFYWFIRFDLVNPNCSTGSVMCACVILCITILFTDRCAKLFGFLIWTVVVCESCFTDSVMFVC